MREQAAVCETTKTLEDSMAIPIMSTDTMRKVSGLKVIPSASTAKANGRQVNESLEYPPGGCRY